ncbi:Disease resistance RPP8-like protein 3 [Bienertia sinuspersici]
MADIQSAAQWLGRLLVEEAKYLSSVEDKVHELRDELEWLQCYLREADSSQHNSNMARRWVSQIREFTYDAEDTVEEFLINVVTDKGRRTFCRWVKNLSKVFVKAAYVHNIGVDIDTLTHKISLLTSKLQTYNINLQLGGSSTSWLLRKKPTFTTVWEKRMFGRNRDLDKLVAVLQDLLSCLTSKSTEQICQMTDSEMKDELHRVQRKQRCFIVLDGIWEKQVWESLKESFPIESRGFGSMLLITSRQKEVLEHEDHMHQVAYHELKPLNRRDGKSLLNEIVKDLVDVPEGRKEMKYNMLEHCEGLPLAISVLGGVLATKNPKDWENVLKYLNSYSIDDQQTDQKCQRWRRILELGYYELPYMLKPGFLYLGYFLTNLEIPTKKIIRLWEAEGLVSSDDDEISEWTLERIAESCLGELVERSLVQVGSRGLTGKAKTCRVHDLVSELCKNKAKQGNLLSIVPLGDVRKDQYSSSHSSKKSSKSSKKKIRRLAVYYTNTSAKLSFDDRHGKKNIRSLLFFNTLSSKEVLLPLKQTLNKAFGEYKLLRVLDIENIEVQTLPRQVGGLIHLRYLSIRGSWVSKLPSTIQFLRCLQTLDLRVLSFVRVRVPDVIYKLGRLIHLYLPSKSFDLRHKADELQLKELKNLETLSNFCNKCRAEDVGHLSNLRRFSSCDFIEDPQSIKPLLECPSPKLEHLDHVSLSLDGKILKEERETLASCSKLFKLWVKGEIAGSLTHDMLPKTLIELSFNNSRFESDPMQAIGKLPHLKKLSIKNAAYLGTAMKCSRRDFPELKYLVLKGLDTFEDWTIEETAMKKLYHLKIQRCQNLKMMPEGLKSIESLRELEISYMPLPFFDSASPRDIEKSWSHYYKVKHVPDIRISQVLDLDRVIINTRFMKIHVEKNPFLAEKLKIVVLPTLAS